MTYSRVKYLVEWDAQVEDYEPVRYLKGEEFFTLHEALDFAQPKLLMGEEVHISPIDGMHA